jgi:tetratricopeptide (TPR) repeat protein
MSPGRERRVGRIREVWSSCGLSGALAWLLLGLTITSECRAQESLYQAYWDAGSKAFQAKDWNTAQQMYQKSYDAAVAAWGANSVQAAETSFNVGASWLNQGKTAEARENYLRAYRIVYQSADPKIRDFTVDTALQVAKCHNRMKDFEKALPLLKWGLAVREKANDEPGHGRLLRRTHRRACRSEGFQRSTRGRARPVEGAFGAIVCHGRRDCFGQIPHCGTARCRREKGRKRRRVPVAGARS